MCPTRGDVAPSSSRSLPPLANICPELATLGGLSTQFDKFGQEWMGIQTLLGGNFGRATFGLLPTSPIWPNPTWSRPKSTVSTPKFYRCLVAFVQLCPTWPGTGNMSNFGPNSAKFGALFAEHSFGSCRPEFGRTGPIVQLCAEVYQIWATGAIVMITTSERFERHAGTTEVHLMIDVVLSLMLLGTPPSASAPWRRDLVRPEREKTLQKTR